MRSHASSTLLQQAQALRDARDWDAALKLYHQGQQQHPGEAAYLWGEIYVLADSGAAAQAVTMAQQLLEQAPRNVDVLLVMAYAQLRQHGVFASLEYVDRAMAEAGERSYVVREYVLALQRAHQPEAALRIAQQYPGLLSPMQHWELQADALAFSVRFADLSTRSEEERFAIADRTLQQYRQLLTQLQYAGAGAEPLYQRVRLDRLQAFHARYAMQELVQEFQALQTEGVPIPDYVMAQVAAAYLYLRQPERAAQLYEQLIQRGYLREDADIRRNQDQGLLFAYADQGAVGTAQQLAPVLAQHYAPWRYVEGDAQKIPNAPYLDAIHTSTLMDLYANATPNAQHRLEHMVRTAPANNNLRTDLAQLYRIRGWPRLAEQELKIAESRAARAHGVEVEQGLTALDLQEWQQAEQLSADVLARFPEDQRSQRLARLWQVYQMRELQVSAYKGLSQHNPSAGSRDFGMETTLYSQPLAYHWRLLAGFGYRSARFDDGKGRQNFGRVGLEWRSRDWTVLGEVVQQRYGYGPRTGAGLRVNYQLSDTWSLQTTAQWRARDTNLNALHHRVSSNQLEFGVRWRQSERRAWQLSLSPSRFSDGNQHWDALLTGQERLWTRPTWWLDAGLELSATHNSRTDVPYYSPRLERRLLPSLTLQHTLLRRYETAWTQQISLEIGSVHEQGFGPGSMTLLSYGQRFQAHDTLELGATLSHQSRPYDGVREGEWRLVLDMTLRF